MANWKHNLIIRDLLTNEVNLTEEQYTNIANNISGRVTTFITKCMDEDLCFALDEVIDMLQLSNDEETINNALDVLYDVADYHRVWIK